jgi:hypothetical protein
VALEQQSVAETLVPRPNPNQREIQFSGSTPVVGDWNGDGRTKVGVFNMGIWVLDVNGNGAWDQPSENPFQFGGGSVAQTPVPGRW